MKLIGDADYYPAGQGRTFNMDYYLKAHIPLLKTNGAAMKTITSSLRG